jgi:type VI secretion system protein ImpH
MATQGGRTDPSLEQLLFEQGYRFDFFQAVRLLERLYPERLPVGRNAVPSKEAARIRSLVSLSFPPSAIYEVNRPEDDSGPPQITVSFMGLAGLVGVLPRHYTELLLERIRYKDFALRDFLDIFNHRVISLFYQAWEKYRFPIAYERARSRGDSYDPFSLLLFHVVGMGTGGLRNRIRPRDEALIYYGGLVAQQPRSASALGAILADFFGVPVKVEQFIGAWLRLDEPNRTRIGRNNCRLGVDAMVGSRSWDQQAGFRLVIGPLRLAEFRRLLPDRTGFGALVDLTRFLVGLTLDCDLQLVLKAAEVPFCALKRPGPDALRLGWSSWLKTKEFSHDATDAMLGSHLTRLKSPHNDDVQSAA